MKLPIYCNHWWPSFILGLGFLTLVAMTAVVMTVDTWPIVFDAAYFFEF